MTYEEKQLQRLNLKGVHPLKIVVHDDQGNKTNFMGLNQDLIKALRVIESQQRKKQKWYQKNYATLNDNKEAQQ